MSVSEDRREDDNSSVRVAIRIRPQNAREKIDACQMCTTVGKEEKQILLGKDKAFTFDYVFDVETQQDAIYNQCVRNLVEGCFEGYNATVFAYGQTGSGKTFTMGTGFDTSLTTVTDDIGIIPRAVDHLFMGIEERRRQAFEDGEPAPDFKVTAQFMELYHEEIYDLLDTTKDCNVKGRKSQNRIHEDASGGIFVVGVNTRPVTSLDDTLKCLKSGALSRATASTNMNVSSSRSHAIFTLHVRQHRMVKDEVPLEEGKETDSTQTEFETLTAKFHFVDLAGSERLKRTGATGDRAKEGISINCGLLALGNVISALGDKTKRGSHVPYRDSKLTRLLQDSLGGNSRTLMIACISPSDRDFMETLNTLKYANRARNIKNKVTANQDKASRQLAQLRSEIATLQQELMEFKTGKKTIDADGMESVNDMVAENSMLQSENDKLRQRIKALQDTIEMLKARNSQLLADAAVFSVLGTDGQASNEDVSNLIRKYIHEIEDLKTKLAESEFMCEQLNKSTARSPRFSARMSLSSMSLTSSFAGGMEAPVSPDYMETSVLHDAKKEIKKLKKLQKSYSHVPNQESDKENIHVGASTRDDDQATSQEKSDEEINGDDDIGDEEDETDVDEENSDSDMSSGSDGEESDNVHEDLANVMCEITIKQRLIEELEQTQKKMNSLKMHYESKVQQLQLKIKETEIERDKVLSEIEKMSHSTADTTTTRKVKQEFEKKLGTLQEELKKMQTEQRKHAKVQKNNSQYERHLKTLQHELAEMKKTRVKLMKQVKEEVDKNRQNEMRHNKEFSQLRKEQLKKDNLIKTLERKTIQKDVVLKRKQEEVEALRKRQKPLSSKAAGRVGKYDRPTTVPIASVSLTSRKRRRSEFSPKVAKQKWDSLEKNIVAVISKRQTVSMLERDMNVWLRQREKCTKQREKYERRKQAAQNSGVSEEAMYRLNRTIEDLALKVEHAQENINECQSNIVQIEESKEDREGSVEINSLLEAITLEESKYIIEKFYQKELDTGFSVVQKESEMKELQGRLHQTELNNALQQDLLRHMMDDNVNIEVDDLMTHDDPDANSSTYSSEMESSSSSTSSSPAESMMESSVVSVASPREKLTRREKARRKTATAQDLLYAGGSEPPALLPLMEAADETKEFVGRVLSSPRIVTPSFAVTSLKTSDFSADVPAENVGANSGSTESVGDVTEGKSPVSDGDDKLLMPPSRLPLKQRSVISSIQSPLMRDANFRLSPIPRKKELPQREASPILGRRNLSRSISLGDTSSDTTPPASPTTVRRSMTRSTDENVFSRLTSNPASSLANPDRGSILPSWSRQSGTGGTGKALLTCTHTAEGHTKSVLSVFATDHLLFTGSKDRTAKVWDLGTGKELMSFSGHSNNVHKVTYCSQTQLVLTVSHSSIRIWDMRNSSEPCIKTLSSSGLSTSGSTAFTVNKPTDFLFRDHQINDIQLSPDGNTLFCGAGNVVQIWDLRRFSLAGRLSGHQAPVMALALNCEGEHSMVISGSKDHYIKIFEVIEDAAGIISPKYNLEPPHYDGIQSLALRGNVLFSGSRDMCIKKWDLSSRQLRHSINAAHKDWVCALDYVPGTNILLSGCRGGFLKMWQPDTCVSLGEIRAHSSAINAIATNSTSIFTASNDTTVHIWRTAAQLRAKKKCSRHRLL